MSFSKIAVLGLGKVGALAARLLHASGFEVTGIDTRSPSGTSPHPVLKADLAAADAIYTYLLDLIELQRAISWFQDEKSQAEQDDFVRRVKAVMSTP